MVCAPQRRKLVEFFRGVDTDPVRALRVSRYLPEKLVRFSVWDETGTARAAVSLDEDEASRLAEFVTHADEEAEPHRRLAVAGATLGISRRRVEDPASIRLDARAPAQVAGAFDEERVERPERLQELALV